MTAKKSAAPPRGARRPADRKPPSRPSLQRKITPADEKTRTDALERGLRVTLGDEPYTIRMGDISPDHARTLRRVTGMSWNALTDQLAMDPDIDTIQTFIWFARILDGEDIPLSDVKIDYDLILSNGFAVSDAEPDDDGDEDDGPEA